MKERLLINVVAILMSMLKGEHLRKLMDLILDFVENYVQESKTPIDDAIAMPICTLIRTTFDIPDKD